MANQNYSTSPKILAIRQQQMRLFLIVNIFSLDMLLH